MKKIFFIVLFFNTCTHSAIVRIENKSDNKIQVIRHDHEIGGHPGVEWLTINPHTTEQFVTSPIKGIRLLTFQELQNNQWKDVAIINPVIRGLDATAKIEYVNSTRIETQNIGSMILTGLGETGKVLSEIAVRSAVAKSKNPAVHYYYHTSYKKK